MPPGKRSKYKYVDSSTDLLPGSYLWWSIDNSIKYKPHRSRYGSVAIYGSIKFVFEHYQKSLPKDPLTGKFPKIELRIGGTLRYKFEICYVIIVCKEKEPTLPYDKYPVWPEGRKIRLNSKNVVSFINSIKVKKIKGAASWNNHVFGFHFPHGQHQMICPKSDFNETDKIIHTSDNCIKKIPQKDLPSGTRSKWICPDEIASDTQIKRKRSNDSHEDERKSKRRHCDNEDM
ncbi:PREDICTED: uncharacterized protein LOC109581149 [Amphimedon queenslandica]|uniref:Uncharacterized protein n=1 Tax=Amphimedon queenslandica TaxID=400682 RepID=A0AAN0J0J3_AMPQE|nr:PREDICTED: uncharacterized protein LOC109581149 [Amphimedon queenslandica]|eukprot:XP_019850539.1 PREDICTED: uncharacterized protein LOC109581149 [Amphimedon queenslandica]